MGNRQELTAGKTSANVQEYRKREQESLGEALLRALEVPCAPAAENPAASWSSR